MELLKNAPLSNYTYYGIGGLADELYKINTIEDLAPLWAETNTQQIPKIMLGKGANLVFSDHGFRGRVFIFTGKKITWDDNRVSVEAGADLQKFIENTNEQGFEDLCALSGIPSSLGGMIRGNAGALGVEIGNVLESVEFLDQNGKRQIWSTEKCQFGYRESIFKSHPEWAIVRGNLKLKQKTHPELALKKTRNILKDRWMKFPPGQSGGCVFKNTDKGSTGQLLDQFGAKGDQLGNIKISEKHANFLVNLGNARQTDLLALMRKWQKIVREKTGIKLEPEIFLCDEYGQKIEL